MADMTLEEALAAADVSTTPVNDILMIDPESRTIIVPASEMLFGVRQDMDAERKHFKCPKIVGDNIDLSQCHIYISYVPSKQDGTYDINDDVGGYWCEDLAVDGDYITFSWKLSGNVFVKAGYIAFAVYAKQEDADGNMQTKWHTTFAIGKVLDTLPDGEQIAEKYADVIEQLLNKMENVEKVATPEAMKGYVEEFLNENPPSGMTDEEREQLNKNTEDISSLSEEKVDKPAEDGTEGQVLAKGADGNVIWKDAMIELEDGSVTPKKTDFLEFGCKNLLYGTEAIIASENLEGQGYANRIKSPKLSVEAGKKYYFYLVSRYNYDTCAVFWYDESELYIGNSSLVATTNGAFSSADAPDNAAYMLVWVKNVSNESADICGEYYAKWVVTTEKLSNSNISELRKTYLRIAEEYDGMFEFGETDKNKIMNIVGFAEDKCYRFANIGKILPTDSYFKYACWSTNLMHFDSDLLKFVHVIKTSTAHGGSEDCGFITFIDPITLNATEPAKMYFGDNWAKWINGFIIDDDGNYLVWYYDYETSPRQMHRIISTDKGGTWTDNGVCSMPTETGYFQLVTKLSSGTLIGSYDDGTIPTSGTSTVTKIARSTDGGLTWEDIEITSSYFSVEQSFVEIDGTIMLIGRKNAYGSSMNTATIAFSIDDGLTWTKEVASKTINMHCGDAMGFVHDGIVEIFANTRYYNNSFKVGSYIGEMNHYIATKEDALKDQFLLIEKFYITGTDSASFHGPSLAMDDMNNVLISFSSDIPSGTLPSDLRFIYSSGSGGCRPVCCDGRASDMLPYSGSKVEELIKALDERISKLENV